MPDSIEDGLEAEDEEDRGGARSRASSVRSAAGTSGMMRHWQNMYRVQVSWIKGSMCVVFKLKLLETLPCTAISYVFDVFCHRHVHCTAIAPRSLSQWNSDDGSTW